MIMFDRRLVKNFGWLILFLALVFSAFGLINLYSASYHTGLGTFKKQVIWVSVGFITMLLITFMNSNLLKRYATHIFLASLVTLAFVFIFGREVSGSRSWLVFGPM